MSQVKRIILKLSGEALADEKNLISVAVLQQLANEVKTVVDRGIEVGIVIGGGNIIRGGSAKEFTRVTGDHLGMLATIMNALAMADVFKRSGIAAEVMSALGVDSIVKRYLASEASQKLTEHKVLIFAAGTGNPFVTTDTALCLRGIELNADLIFKATNVDGVYTADPKRYPEATRYEKLTYAEAIERKLAVMDQAAFCLGQNHDLHLVVFDLKKPGVLARILDGETEGTLITN